MPFMDVTQAAEAFAVHQIKEHFLSFGRKAVNLVEEEDATMRLFNQSLTVSVSSCVRAAYNTKEVGHEQLGVIGIIRAVEADKGSAGRQRSKFERIGVHEAGQRRLTESGWATEERMQATWWVKNSCLCLLYGHFQPIAAANQGFKAGDNGSNLNRSSYGRRLLRFQHRGGRFFCLCRLSLPGMGRFAPVLLNQG